MEKAKIYGVGTAADYAYLIVKREAHFFRWLNGIFEEFNLPRADGFAETDKEGFDTGRFIEKRIEDYVDVHEKYSTKDGLRIDVFHGKERAFLVLHVSEDNWTKFMKMVEGSSEFITKPEKKLREVTFSA